MLKRGNFSAYYCLLRKIYKYGIIELAVLFGTKLKKIKNSKNSTAG